MMITNLWFGDTAFLDLDLAHKDSMTSSFGPKNWSFKKFVFKYVNLWNETNFLMESKCDAKHFSEIRCAKTIYLKHFINLLKFLNCLHTSIIYLNSKLQIYM